MDCPIKEDFPFPSLTYLYGSEFFMIARVFPSNMHKYYNYKLTFNLIKGETNLADSLEQGPVAERQQGIEQGIRLETRENPLSVADGE